MSAVDVLAIGAHPDDIELGCAGTLLVLQARGYSFAMLDVTAGEAGSRGDRATRATEAAAAAKLLGARARVGLGLPDTGVVATEENVRLLVAALRRLRPRLVISMHEEDAHPDHAATAVLVKRAVFFAALTNYESVGAPHRVGRVIRYSRHGHLAPAFVVDISEVVEQKLAALGCYESQFTRSATGARTPISAPDYFDDLRALWRHHGRGVGALYAEPFFMDGPPALTDPVAALCVERRDVGQ